MNHDTIDIDIDMDHHPRQ